MASIDLPKPLDSEYSEIAWGIEKCGEDHKPLWIPRPKVTDHQVKFEMLFCGICHTDLHIGKGQKL